jgi:hypothetical protein
LPAGPVRTVEQLYLSTTKIVLNAELNISIDSFTNFVFRANPLLTKAMNTKKTYSISLFLILALFSSFRLSAQYNSARYDLSSLLQENKLEIFNRTVASFTEGDKKGIRFSKKENDGVAWVKHLIFTNGNIELDIRGSEEFQQSFVGIAFHAIDNNTFDAIYFRPFNFQTDDTVRRIHAVQYVSMPDYSWQVLREKFNGTYEKAVIPAPKGTEWFHVKIVVNDPSITVFVNGNTKPCLTVEKLNKRVSGKIGLWVGNESAGDFANLQITPLD